MDFMAEISMQGDMHIRCKDSATYHSTDMQEKSYPEDEAASQAALLYRQQNGECILFEAFI